MPKSLSILSLNQLGNYSLDLSCHTVILVDAVNVLRCRLINILKIYLEQSLADVINPKKRDTNSAISISEKLERTVNTSGENIG